MTGLVGIVMNEDCARDLFYTLDYHSHLGTARGGMAIRRPDNSLTGKIHDISRAQFKSRFYDEFPRMKGNLGIGAISDKDPQPLRMQGKFGSEVEQFSIVTCGRITNLDELGYDLGSISNVRGDNSLNMTEVVAGLIGQGNTIPEGIERMYEKIKGSCSLLMLTKEGIYAARDSFGRSPLIIGNRKDSRFKDEWAVVSETCSFHNLGFEKKKDLKPGEIVLMNEKGIQEIRSGHDSPMQLCAFYHVYTGDLVSKFEGISAQTARHNCGALLAERDFGLDVDMVFGVPDSGLGHGHGYLNRRNEMVLEHIKELYGQGDMDALGEFLQEASVTKWVQGAVKYTAGWGVRSYVPPTQEERDMVAKMKLNPGDIKDKDMIINEDSIVRGTQLLALVDKLRAFGAKDIHARVSCPPLTSPCEYLRSTKTKDELVANRAIMDLEGKHIDDIDTTPYLDHTTPQYESMVKWIKEDLHLTSLEYLHKDELSQAIGLPAEKLCMQCWK